jgi:protein-tyrosine phosphatase
VGPVERSLAWDGCFNVRDLGGLETASGRRTRHGAVVRADNVRRLTTAGWQAALDHGIRRVVDLRFEGESPDEADVHADVEVVAVSLFGRHDPDAAKAFDERLLATDDVGSVFAAGYIRTLERAPQRVAAAVAAVADANDEHGVLIHCFAGKDRTGIVSALLLGVADVPDESIAADYAASGANMGSLFDTWVARARDEAERKTRQRSALSPAGTMEAVLAWVREAGGSSAFLRDAGLTADQVGRLERRLISD